MDGVREGLVYIVYKKILCNLLCIRDMAAESSSWRRAQSVCWEFWQKMVSWQVGAARYIARGRVGHAPDKMDRARTSQLQPPRLRPQKWRETLIRKYLPNK